MIHTKKLGISVAYDMFLECCEGNFNEDWFISEKSRMYLHEFRENLSTQMMNYDPRHNKFKGDIFMIKYTNLEILCCASSW